MGGTKVQTGQYIPWSPEYAHSALRLGQYIYIYIALRLGQYIYIALRLGQYLIDKPRLPGIYGHKQPSPSGFALGLGQFMDHKSQATAVYLLNIALPVRAIYIYCPALLTARAPSSTDYITVTADYITVTADYITVTADYNLHTLSVVYLKLTEA